MKALLKFTWKVSRVFRYTYTYIIYVPLIPVIPRLVILETALENPYVVTIVHVIIGECDVLALSAFALPGSSWRHAAYCL
jgi:hypothetical protein